MEDIGQCEVLYPLGALFRKNRKWGVEGSVLVLCYEFTLRFIVSHFHVIFFHLEWAAIPIFFHSVRVWWRLSKDSISALVSHERLTTVGCLPNIHPMTYFFLIEALYRNPWVRMFPSTTCSLGRDFIWAKGSQIQFLRWKWLTQLLKSVTFPIVDDCSL